MTDIVPYAALATALMAVLALAKFWMDMGATARNASDALVKAEGAAKDLASFKEAVAKEYASTQELAASEVRLATAIEGIRGDFRSAVSDITGRIDRFLTTMGAK